MFVSSVESPLTFAAHLDNMVEIIKVLKNSGAHLDFRARDGLTALHKAAQSKNLVSLTVAIVTIDAELFQIMTESFSLHFSARWDEEKIVMIWVK